MTYHLHAQPSHKARRLAHDLERRSRAGDVKGFLRTARQLVATAVADWDLVDDEGVPVPTSQLELLPTDFAIQLTAQVALEVLTP